MSYSPFTYDSDIGAHMQLTLNSLTALRFLRAIRCGTMPGNLERRCDLLQPDPSPRPHVTNSKTPAPPKGNRWSKRAIQGHLERFGDIGVFSETHPLNVLAPSKESRLQVKDVTCAFRTGPYPPKAFVNLGRGIAISGPELLYLELSRIMDPDIHLLLGMELCGCYSRSALDPREGPIAYNLKPATTVERLRAFAMQAHGMHGARRTLEHIDQIQENAWSPMEAIIALLLTLPPEQLGYDLWPIVLNPRKESSERLQAYSERTSRVPDIMFRGTNVGLNYDGEDHFGLERIARSAIAADRNPGDAALAHEAAEAIVDARRRIVADKRRDRDLGAQGLHVFPVTKEDLYESGGLDRVVGQVVESIDQGGQRRVEEQRTLLSDKAMAASRQLFIWSLLPGAHSLMARRQLQETLAKQAHEEEAAKARAEQIAAVRRLSGRSTPTAASVDQVMRSVKERSETLCMQTQAVPQTVVEYDPLVWRRLVEREL